MKNLNFMLSSSFTSFYCVPLPPICLFQVFLPLILFHSLLFRTFIFMTYNLLSALQSLSSLVKLILTLNMFYIFVKSGVILAYSRFINFSRLLPTILPYLYKHVLICPVVFAASFTLLLKTKRLVVLMSLF